MNELIQSIQSRRSIRCYKRDPVPRELIDQVAQAGTYAPTAMGEQSPIILAVTDQTVRDQLSRLNAQVMGGMLEDPFYGAPAVLVVLADKSKPNHLYDGTLVMANLMLAAHALGLGSCWVHRAKEVFEMPEGKALLASLGIQGEYEGIGHCILCYPDGPTTQPAPRKENYIYHI